MSTVGATPARLVGTCLAVAIAACLIMAMPLYLGGYQPPITMRFLGEDVIGAVVMIAALFGLSLLLRKAHPALPVVSPWLIAALVFAATWGGARLLLGGYALTVDEAMAVFDSRIIAKGALLAPVAPEWRPFATALLPVFRMEVPGDAYWASLYLPGNAAIRAAASFLGDPAIGTALCAALAIPLIAGIARILWPTRREGATVAMLLLACSSQFLVMAMTPYAMPAHLVCNLLWLRLVLSDKPAAQGAAVAVAFVATGLHQMIFFPLFAAPFLLTFWGERARGKALFHAAAIGAILLFWIAYWNLAVQAEGIEITRRSDLGGLFFVDRVLTMLSRFQFAGSALMGANLLRLTVWQHPLTVPLFLLGTTAAWRAGGPLRALLLGVLLTLAAIFVLLPYQAHGWGYRYLHGLLGNLCLIATAAWLRIENMRKQRLFAAGTATALLVMLPLHLWQARALTSPYASAYRRIAATDADIVLVDPNGLQYGVDLVRNDPWLGERPKLMDVRAIPLPALAGLCASGKALARFDVSDGVKLGMWQGEAVAPSVQRREIDRLGCAARHVLP